jgi:hypothetical protein
MRGLIFGPDGRAMPPKHAHKDGRCYRYYVSTVSIKRGENDGPIRRVPAGPVDQTVIEQVRLLVERVDVSENGIRVRLKTEGLRDVVRELRGAPSLEQAA